MWKNRFDTLREFRPAGRTVRGQASDFETSHRIRAAERLTS